MKLTRRIPVVAVALLAVGGMLGLGTGQLGGAAHQAGGVNYGQVSDWSVNYGQVDPWGDNYGQVG